MPKNIRKSLSDYLSKIKTPRSQIHLPSKKWILGGCKTPSFSMDDKRNRAHSSGNKKNKKTENEATLDDIDRFLFDNFRTLFLGDDEEIGNSNNNNNTHKVHNNTRSVSSKESRGKSPIPSPTLIDLFKEPSLDLGSSISAAKAVQNGDDPCSKQTTTFTDNCVAVLACSKSPYEEFKRSMEGVVEARLMNGEKVDWDFMEELLSCYMNMNGKKSHKFIIAAYVDVISPMRHPPQPALEKPRSVRTMKIVKDIRKKTEEVKLE